MSGIGEKRPAGEGVGDSAQKKKKKNNSTPKKPIALSISNSNNVKSPGVSLKERKGELRNSMEEADKLFQWMISPKKQSEFYESFWEKTHLHIKRNNPSYYAGWFCKDDIDLMLSEHTLKYGKNIDVTNYVEGKRLTLNAEGRAYPAAVWKSYSEGCSLRLLNPQGFHNGVWKMLSILQEHFGNFTGANIYLTPKGAQGFSPHYDDVEVFILQLEGAKTWRLYNHPEESDVLARVSSRNYAQEEIGEPIFEETLYAGDMLYLPRGTIHQAVSPPDTHSLHLTVSSYQKNSWVDFLEHALPQALQAAAESDVELRKGLPRNFLNYMGVANQSFDDEEAEGATRQERAKADKREEFLAHVQKLLQIVAEHIPYDGAADQMGIKYHHSALPPVLLPQESTHNIVGRPIADVNLLNNVRLVRANAFRVVLESAESRGKKEGDVCTDTDCGGCENNDIIAVYFHTENSRLYQEQEPQVIEFAPEAGPGLEFLLDSYEQGWVGVKHIPVETPEEKVDIANALYERGLLVVKEA